MPYSQEMDRPEMKETSKMQSLRAARGDFARYLIGEGIDIGSGDDPLLIEKGSVTEFDREQGDAADLRLTDGSFLPRNHYDFVYSSHTLEDMPHPTLTLREWLKILKPGGILYFTVPDFDLYEQGHWPSKFNPAHKASFTMKSNAVIHGNMFYMPNLAWSLDRYGCECLELRLEDYGYNYELKDVDQTLGNAVAQICYIGKRV